MGRRKRDVYEGTVDLFSEPLVPEKWDTVCPLCGKKFLATSDLCYYVDNKLTCSWKCFFEHVTKWEIDKMKQKDSQPKHGRKPKEIFMEEEESDPD